MRAWIGGQLKLESVGGAPTVARGFRALIAAAVNGVAREGDCFFRRNRCGRFHGAVRAVTRRSVLALAKMPLLQTCNFNRSGHPLPQPLGAFPSLLRLSTRGCKAESPSRPLHSRPNAGEWGRRVGGVETDRRPRADRVRAV